jgi:ribosomal protein L16 Arg81 hydroxylase
LGMPIGAIEGKAMPSATASRIPDVAGQGTKSASNFHDTVTLQSLIAPVGEEEFLASYWEKQPLIVHRNDPNYYGDLFTLDDFDESITRGPSYVKTAEAITNKQAKHQGATPTALERILSDMNDGHTLILDGMHQFDPKLRTMCSRLGRETGFNYQTNLYLTPPNGKGFTPHWDNHDVFVMQIMGSKHWKVEKDRRTLPEKTANIEEEGREFRGEVYDFTLQQGDMVYIPRGFVHAAECGSENSLHITVGTYFPTWEELLAAVIRMAAFQEQKLRHALPVGYIRGEGADIRNRMQEELQRMLDPAFLNKALDQFRDEYVKKATLDISGQLRTFFRPKELKLDDRIGVRPGLLFTLRQGQETVNLNVGTRTIIFPDFLVPTLDFALNTPDFAIADLPGELEDEEKIVVAQRLMQEALIVRK